MDKALHPTCMWACLNPTVPFLVTRLTLLVEARLRVLRLGIRVLCQGSFDLFRKVSKPFLCWRLSALLCQR